MRARLCLLSLFLTCTLATAGTDEWAKALKAASRDLPALADPKSDLSVRTGKLRDEYFKSSDPVKVQAAKSDAAMYIATEALAQLDQERRTIAATQEQLKALWGSTGGQVVAKFPDAEDPKSSLSLFASAIVDEWLAAQDPRLKSEDAFFQIFAEATKLNKQYEEKLAKASREQSDVTGVRTAIKSLTYLANSQAEMDRLTSEAAKMQKDMAKMAEQLQKPSILSQDIKIDWEATARNRGRDATVAALQKFCVLLKERHGLDLSPNTWPTDEKKYKAAARVLEADGNGQLTILAAEFAEHFNSLMGNP